MAAFTKVDSLNESIAEKIHNLGSDQLMVALTNTAPVTTNTVLANITEITYTNISSRVLTTTSSSTSSGVYRLILADLTLTASGAVGPFRYIVIYNNTATNKDLIGFSDYGSSISLANGETFRLDFDNVNGLLAIS
jgi:hypothetical protein